jgi:hypothetical protein
MMINKTFKKSMLGGIFKPQNLRAMSTQPYIYRQGIPDSKLTPLRRINEEIQAVNGFATVIAGPLVKAYLLPAMPTLLPIYLFFMGHGAREEGIRLL